MSDVTTIAAEAGYTLAVKIVAASDIRTTEFVARALHDASAAFVQSSLARGFPPAEIEAALTVMADAFERRFWSWKLPCTSMGALLRWANHEPGALPPHAYESEKEKPRDWRRRAFNSHAGCVGATERYVRYSRSTECSRRQPEWFVAMTDFASGYDLKDPKAFRAWCTHYPSKAALLREIINRWQNARVYWKDDPKHWTVYPLAMWCEWIGTKRRTLNWLLKCLEDEGLIERSRHKFSGRRIHSYIRPTELALTYWKPKTKAAA